MAWESAYAADHIDLLLRLKEVVTGRPLVTMPVRTGTGNGIVCGIHTTVASTPIENWSVTCTNNMLPATFSVVGSVSGSQGTTQVGSAYSSAQISLQLTAGSTPFQVGDQFVFSTQTNPLIANAQTWQVNRWVGDGARVVNYQASSIWDGDGGNDPVRAIDLDIGEAGGSDSAWASELGQGVGSWWQVQYNKPVDIRRLALGNYQDGYHVRCAPSAFHISYSDDGSTWVTDSSFTGQLSWQVSEIRSYPLSGTSGAHTYWRITLDNMQVTYWSLNDHNTGIIPFIGLYDASDTYNSASYGTGYDCILQGPGTGAGDEIFIQIRPDSNILNGPNWIVSGSVGYGSGLPTFSQPGNCQEGFSDALRLALFDQPMKYWIIVSGRRIMVFCRFQNITTGCHLGLILPYAMPNQYPYPLLIAGSQSAKGANTVQNYGWERQDGRHRLFMNPGSDGSWPYHDTIDRSSSSTRLFTPYNVWKQASNTVNNSAWSSATNGNYNNLRDGSNGHQSLVVWPYQTENNTSTCTTLGPQKDGKWPMSPIVFLDKPEEAAYGEVEGVKHLPGVHALESVITYEGEVWVILNNVYRTADNDYFAVRLS